MNNGIDFFSKNEKIIINMNKKINQLKKHSITKADEINIEYLTAMIDYLNTNLKAISVLLGVEKIVKNPI